MKIIQKKPSELKPYENNPRKNEKAVPFVAESIKEFGFKVPIIIDRDNVIIAGHTRLKAAERLQLETVPCIVADDLTEEQINAFRLADNKVAEIATWDFELLREELEEIEMPMGVFSFPDVQTASFDFDFTPIEMPEDEEPTETKPKQIETVKCPYCGCDCEV